MTQPIIPSDHESKTAPELLSWAIESFGDAVVLASSFGLEDMVLIDMLCAITKPTIITLDTGRLHEETYALMDTVREKYTLNLMIFFPKTEAVEEMVNKQGVNSFYTSVENRKLCCGIRKIEPLKRALAGKKAWITGLRKEQNNNRATTHKVEVDKAHGDLYKLNPLADWTEAETWEYIKKNNVPYNALHDYGFPSIGCAPCTRAVLQGEDPRSGRWWWENDNYGKKECGLHTN